MPLTGTAEALGARPIRVLPIIGIGGGEAWQALAALDGIQVAAGSDSADLLALAGDIPAQWESRLAGAALPPAVWLRDGPPRRLPRGPRIRRIVPSSRLARIDPDRALRPLVDRPGAGGRRPGLGSPLCLSTAGAVSGRARQLLLGPHYPLLPSGLQLRLELEGDTIVACRGVRNAFPLAAAPSPAPDPLPIAQREAARVYHHLCWMADFLTLLGLGSTGMLLRRYRHGPDPELLPRLLRPVVPVLRRALAGGAMLTANEIAEHGISGPVARSAGQGLDARSACPAYRALGFRPQLQRGGDNWARWCQRVREVQQSLRLLAVAGDLVSAADEAPRGQFRHCGGSLRTPSAALLPLLAARLPGMSWREGLVFTASLDLGMDEAALQ